MAGMARRIASVMLVLGLATVPRAAAAPTELSSCQTIFSPGAYVVTQNLSNPSGDCLLLEADQVTIDLNGFVVSGAGSGIASAGGGTRYLTAIRNGTVIGGAHGIGLASGRATMVERVRARGGNGWAVLLAEEAVVKDCIAVDGDSGIQVGASRLVVGNIASDNTAAPVSWPAVRASSGRTRPDATSVTARWLAAPRHSPATRRVSTAGWESRWPVPAPSSATPRPATAANIVLSGHGCTRAHNVPHP